VLKAVSLLCLLTQLISDSQELCARLKQHLSEPGLVQAAMRMTHSNCDQLIHESYRLLGTLTRFGLLHVSVNMADPNTFNYFYENLASRFSSTETL
jgi:hypothetical protein